MGNGRWLLQTCPGVALPDWPDTAVLGSATPAGSAYSAAPCSQLGAGVQPEATRDLPLHNPICAATWQCAASESTIALPLGLPGVRPWNLADSEL
jgi:hypothetical protein